MVMRCLATIVHDQTLTYPTHAHRTQMMDAIVTAAKTFPRDAGVVGGCLCALTHTSAFALEVSVPVGTVVDMVKAHESNAMVVRAATRLLHCHVAHSHVELPRVAEVTACWVKMHPNDHDVAYFAARIMMVAASLDPEEVRTHHGTVGEDTLNVAIVTCAVAVGAIEVHIHGQAWNAYLLDKIFPRRARKGVKKKENERLMRV
jgi:hypothetical protein